MTRAEERALEAYPPKFSSGKLHAKRVQAETVDTHRPIRTIYIKGYEQAEKDLAMSYPMPEDTTIFQKGVAEGRRLEREDFPDNLSWRDIKRIVQIADNMLDDPKMRVAVQNHSEEEYYKSVWKKWRKTVSD